MGKTAGERLQIYKSFQERFPIEELREMTLDEYSNLKKKDSFCFWIESKTDSLGSFWGGSSFKFGIYRYAKRPTDTRVVSDDRYAWYKMYNKATAEEAFELIRNTIYNIAVWARSGDYEMIENNHVLGNSYKWKIAFLYSDLKLIPIYKRKYLDETAKAVGIVNPEKLHVSVIQRMLMQYIGTHNTGTYNLFDCYDILWKKRNDYVSSVSKTKKPSTATTMKIPFFDDAVSEPDDSASEGEIRYWWLVASPKYWTFADIKKGEKVVYTVKNDKGNKRRVPANFEQAKPGDIVIGYEAHPVKSIVALAKVAEASNGETISFVKTEALTTPISWFDFKDNPAVADMEFIKNPNGSFFKLTQEEYDCLMDIIRQNNPEDDNPLLREGRVTPYDDAQFLSEVYMTHGELKHLKDALQQKKNIVLQGAPGVGKTFTAKRLAYAMMGAKDDSRVKMVQFHQSYSYEDFIMGYKPTATGFELREGVFYDFCRKAANDPERDYFFIIDEINRGNLSKIFGELLMLIEKSYRGETIQLAYRKEEFRVPDNLYIIGMMNTADRSLALIDYALRRRFGFISMRPGFDTDGFKGEIERHTDPRIGKVVETVKQINGIISADDSLGEGFCIGHSYFCEHAPTTDWIEHVVRYELCPMVEEYWFDNKDKRDAATSRLLDAIKK